MRILWNENTKKKRCTQHAKIYNISKKKRKNGVLKIFDGGNKFSFKVHFSHRVREKIRSLSIKLQRLSQDSNRGEWRESQTSLNPTIATRFRHIFHNRNSKFSLHSRCISDRYSKLSAVRNQIPHGFSRTKAIKGSLSATINDKSNHRLHSTSGREESYRKAALAGIVERGLPRWNTRRRECAGRLIIPRLVRRQAEGVGDGGRVA